MKKVLVLLAFLQVLILGTVYAAPASDGYSYEVIDGIKAENLWLYSRNQGNYDDIPLGGTTNSRTATISDGVVYIGDSTNDDPNMVDGSGRAIDCASIIKYDAFTGEYLGKLQVKCNGTRVTGFLCANQVGVDSFGNLYMAGYTSEMADNLKVYCVDKETGEATLEADLARTTEGRIDYCDVMGDITRMNAKCVVMAAAASATSLLVYRWEAHQGGEFNPGWFDGDTESCYMEGSYPMADSWSYAPTVKMVAGDEGAEYDAELFYIDGFNTYPALYDIDGCLVDSFENALSLAPNEDGTNGITELQVNGKNFILYSLNQYVAPDFCKMRVAELGEGMAFDGMTKYWDFPKEQGLGSQTDWGTRVHSIATEKVTDDYGHEGAYVLTYKCANGFGVYFVGDKGFGAPDEPLDMIVTAEDGIKDISSSTTPYESITIKEGAQVKAEGANLESFKKLIIERTFTYASGKDSNRQWFNLALPFEGVANSTLVEKFNESTQEYEPAVCGEDYVTFNYNGASRAANGKNNAGDNWDMLDTEGSALGELIQFAEAGTHKYRFTSPNAEKAKAALETGRTGSTYFEDIAEDSNEGWNLVPAGKTYATGAYDIYNGLSSIQIYDSATGAFIPQITGADLKPSTVFAVKLTGKYTPSSSSSSQAAIAVEQYSFELIGNDGKLLDRIYLFDGSNDGKYRLGKMSALNSSAAQMAIKVGDSSYCTYSTLASDNKKFQVSLSNANGATLVMKSAGAASVNIDGSAVTLDTPIAVTDGDITINLGSCTTGVDSITDAIQVTGGEGVISISGAEAGRAYTVSTMTGITTQGTVNGATTKVITPAGIYIVKVANQVVKVIVK